MGPDNQSLSGNREFQSIKVFNDQSVDETTSNEVDARHMRGICLFVETSAGVSGGVVEIESAPYAGYTGTWKQLGTVTTSAASTMYAVTADESQDGLPARVVRARISTVISGGTIDAYILGQS